MLCTKKVMKARFLLILIAAGTFGSCKKDNNSGPKQEITQLQQVEHNIGIIKFEYNQQNQLIKVEQLERKPDGVYKSFQYTTFSYTNGQISKADFFELNKNQFYKRTAYLYHLDPQKKISTVSRTFTYPNGSLGFKDTIKYSFNANNKLVSLGYNNEAEPIMVFDYNNQGNIVTSDYEDVDENLTIAYDFDFRYDNKINPFANNNVGLYFYSVYMDETFSVNQLFSTNNPVYTKSTINETLVDESSNQVLYNKMNSFLYEFANEYDNHGILKLAGMTYNYERKENGHVVDTDNNQSDIKYTCVKTLQ